MPFPSLLHVSRAWRDLPGQSGRKVGAGLSLLFLAGTSLMAVVIAWRLLAPQVFTMSELSWIGTLAVAMLLTIGIVSLRARATRSIAHVLYDTEHPSGGRR